MLDHHRATVDIDGMSTSAIRGLMEEGERVLAEDVVEGANGRSTPLVVTSRAFYLSVGGRYTRYPYARLKAATFDIHDVFIALDGQALRMKYRPGTDRSEALQALRRQVALARFSAA
jgi:phosphatidylserine decarboxylase